MNPLGRCGVTVEKVVQGNRLQLQRIAERAGVAHPATLAQVKALIIPAGSRVLLHRTGMIEDVLSLRSEALHTGRKADVASVYCTGGLLNTLYGWTSGLRSGLPFPSLNACQEAFIIWLLQASPPPRPLLALLAAFLPL